MNQYIGLWRRASVQIGESLPYEDTVVYWLQAETYFADIRIPFSQPSLSQPLSSLSRDNLLDFAQFSAFAGKIDCTETWIRWHRQIDFRLSSDIDQGDVHFDGENLIERGESTVDGKVEAYTEVWVPQPDDHSNRLVLELVSETNLTTQATTYPKGLWVTVGNHAIRLYDYRGYAANFIAPQPSELFEAELKHLMRFQADYSQRNSKDSWEITMSSDPTQIGRSADHPIQQRAGTLIETHQQVSGSVIEYHWKIREATGDFLIDLTGNGF
jgi:hypothetical protein